MRGNGGNGDGDLVRTEGLASTLNVGNVPSSVFEGSAWKGGVRGAGVRKMIRIWAEGR